MVKLFETKGAHNSAKGPIILRNYRDDFLRIAIKDLRDLGDYPIAISFSSCKRREGVSTILYNFAVTIAENIDRKIVVVDANLDSPVLHKWIGVSEEDDGFAEIISGKAVLDDVIVQTNANGEDAFDFIPAGKKKNQSLVHYDSNEFADLMNELRARYDIILFDTPSMVGSPETTIMGQYMSGVIMVVEAEKTRWEVAAHAKRSLETANVNVTGVILNKKKMFIPKVIYKYLLAE